MNGEGKMGVNKWRRNKTLPRTPIKVHGLKEIAMGDLLSTLDNS
jgi:hypothetical protein